MQQYTIDNLGLWEQELEQRLDAASEESRWLTIQLVIIYLLTLGSATYSLAQADKACSIWGVVGSLLTSILACELLNKASPMQISRAMCGRLGGESFNALLSQVILIWSLLPEGPTSRNKLSEPGSSPKLLIVSCSLLTFNILLSLWSLLNAVQSKEIITRSSSDEELVILEQSDEIAQEERDWQLFSEAQRIRAETRNLCCKPADGSPGIPLRSTLYLAALIIAICEGSLVKSVLFENNSLVSSAHLNQNVFAVGTMPLLFLSNFLVRGGGD